MANAGSNNVSVINGTTVVATVSVALSPTAVGYDSENGYVYVADAGANKVSVIDGTTVVATVSVGGTPEGVGYDSGNGFVYVANYGSNTVSVINGTTVVTTLAVGNHPDGVGYDSGNGFVYVANYDSNTVSVINRTTVVATVSVGSYPDAVGFDSGNGFVYVANSGSNNVSVINGTTVVATVAVGSSPDGVGYDSGNKYVYVANGYPSDNVSVLSGTTVVGAIPVRNHPVGVVYDSGNGYVYVANVVANTVSVISATPPIPHFLVTFAEAGLPPGTSWSVALAGKTNTSSATTIKFSEPNGTYPYAVGIVPGYIASPSSGSVPVNGAPLNVAISFTAVTYVVTFAEAGLPPGTSWSVTLSETTHASMTSTIAFSEANGTFAYTVGHVAGYTASPSSGSVTVNGADVSTPVTFTAVPPPTYPVSFIETGLPMGTSWSVTLDGVPRTSGMSTITFSEPNGTYAYSVGSVWGYIASPPSGSVIVNGAGVSTSITFTVAPPPEYDVTFAEAGLPPGTSWSVALAGKTNTSTARTIVFSEPNGTVSFTVGSVTGYTSNPAFGTIAVHGQAISTAITFSPTSVGPTIDSFVVSASTITTGESVTFTATASGGTAPRTYAYTGLPAGCASADTSALMCTPTATGTFTITVAVTDSIGRSATATVSLTVNPPVNTILGLPAAEGYAIFGAIAVATVAGIAVVAVRSRRRRRTRPGVRPPPPPP